MKQGETKKHREERRVGRELAGYQTKAPRLSTPMWQRDLESVEWGEGLESQSVGAPLYMGVGNSRR